MADSLFFPKPAVTHLDYADYDNVRKDIQDRMLRSVTESFPYSNDRYTLNVHNVNYQGPSTYSIKEQKNAIMSGATLGHKLTGSYSVTDNATGQLISRTGRKTLMNVPFLTNRGTFIRNGTEYTVSKQFRLIPNVYTRMTDDGIAESQFNVRPRTGRSFRLYMEPDTALFYMKYANRKIPLYPVLNAMGVQDEALEKSWGPDILKVNKGTQQSPYAVAFLRGFEPDAPAAGEKEASLSDSARSKLLETFTKMQLDADGTQTTLGSPYANVTPDALTAATTKILAVSRRQADTDDRDSMEFQTIHDTADFLEEKVRNDQNQVMRQLLWKLTNKQGDAERIPSAPLDKHISHLFNNSGLAQGIEEINLLDAYDQGQRVVRLGEGGISSVDAVPAESRNVQNSYLNFVDPVRSPESAKVGVDMKLARGTLKGSDGLLYTQFRNARTGLPELVSSKQAARSIVALPGGLAGDKPFVPAMVKAKGIFYIPREEVDYEVESADDMFSTGANTVPLKSGVKSMRLLMGCLKGDTQLLIRRDGALYYQNIAEYTWAEGDETLSLCPNKHSLEWSPVLGHKRNTGRQDMLCVTLKSGRSVTTTTNHAWVTIGPDGNLLEIQAKDLREGTPIPRVGYLPMQADSTKPVCERTRFDLTFDFGWICGLYLADGWLPKYGACTGVAGTPLFVQNKLADFANKYGIEYKLQANKKYPDGYATILWSSELQAFLRDTFGSGSYVKHIAAWVLNSSESFKQGIVAGYIAGDGYVAVRRDSARVFASSRSSLLVKDMCNLLSTLDIDTTITEGTATGKPVYKLEVRAQCIDRLPRLNHPGKDAVISGHRIWSGKKDIYWVPDYRDLRKKVLSVSKRKEAFRHRSYVNQQTRSSLLERIDHTDCPWLSSDVIWDRVKSIAPVTPEDGTYDLDVNDRVFMVNGGVFVHNSKFGVSALPLVNREAPYIRTKEGASSVEDNLGAYMGAVRAKQPGTVKSVTREAVTVAHPDGTVSKHELYDSFPFARKTYARNTPTVKPGDAVDKGTLLATSNYTDDKGAMALGTNMRVAYLNYDGKVFEDAIVISEGAAKKFTSEHMYNVGMDAEDGVKIGKDTFKGLFPARFTKEQLAKVDDNGVVKQGTVLQYGDPMFLAVKERQPSPGTMNRRLRADGASVWEHKYPGVVTDTVPSKTGHSILVRANIPMEVGDKIAMRFGGKGVVSEVVKDAEMPQDQQGRPFDIIMSPLSVVSRTNSPQMIEAALGKIAAKTGKGYTLPGFMDEDMSKFAQKELQKHGLSDTDDIYDPRTKKRIPKIFNGVSYFYKLSHTAESKGKSRSTAGYTQDEQPSRGGKTGCFPGQQTVLTLHGERRISSIVEKQQSEHVWSYDQRTGTWGYRSVTDWFKREADVSDILHVELNNGCSLYPTKNHEVYRYGGEKILAGSLKQGDELITWVKECVAPVVIKKISSYVDPDGKLTCPVYDFTVEGTHNYTAGSVLVSNSKHIGDMEIQSLLSHNATDVLKDLKIVKGQQNDNFWRQLKMGETPVMPGTPLVYEKFKDMIRASGVELREEKHADYIFGMTDAKAKALTGNRRITSTGTYGSNTLKPIPGGLFDPEATGSESAGDRWAYIQLPEPLPNPVMAEPLRTVLGMTQKQFKSLIAGDVEVAGKRGGEALQASLSRLNLSSEKQQTLEAIKSGSRSNRDAAVKRFRYLDALEKNGVKPEDFMMTRVPVLPPRFRPITKSGGMTMVADPNYMYKALMESIEDYEDSKELPMPMRREARENMYNNYESLVGLTDPVQADLQQKGVSGILKGLLSKGSPKVGFCQRRVIGTNIDVSGLGVITPNPSLKLNEVGLPEELAWNLYEPFIVRDMVKNGYEATAAAKAVEGHTPAAYNALQTVVKERPVIINRAPTLHKYSVLAAWPVLTKGHTLQITPTIVSGLGADFDGDSVLTMLKVQIDQESLKEYLKKTENSTCIIDPADLLSGHVNEDIPTNKESDMKFAKGTQIVQNDAVIRIEDIPRLEGTAIELSANVTEWDVVPGVSVYAYDRDTNQHGYFPVTKLSQHRGLPLVDVTVGTAGRYQSMVTCSEDHSLVFYDPDKGVVRDGTPKEALTKMVPVVKNTGKNENEDTRRYMQIGNRVPASQKLGLFLGAMLGDGWVDVADRAYIASIYPELREELMSFLDNSEIPQARCTSTVRSPIRQGGYGSTVDRPYMSEKVDFCITRPAACDLRRLIGSGAQNKKIPHESFQSSDAHLRGLLAGLLATDGTVNVSKTKGKKASIKNIRYETTSPYLRDGLQVLLRRLGIRSGVTSYMGVNSTMPCYIIMPSIMDFVAMCLKHPSFKIPHDKKQEALETIIAETDMTSNMAQCMDLVPYPRHIDEVLRWLRPAAEVSSAQLSTYKAHGWMSRVNASKLVSAGMSATWENYVAYRGTSTGDAKDYTPEQAKDLFMQWAGIVNDTDITWQEVTKIQPAGVQDCWDITVPGPLTFMLASGVIVMDTMSYSVPVSDAAVKQAKETMLPSKNLIAERNKKPMFALTNEYLQGLYFATKQPTSVKPRKFATRADAMQAFKAGDIRIDDPIQILHEK